MMNKLSRYLKHYSKWKTLSVKDKNIWNRQEKKRYERQDFSTFHRHTLRIWFISKVIPKLCIEIDRRLGEVYSDDCSDCKRCVTNEIANIRSLFDNNQFRDRLELPHYSKFIMDFYNPTQPKQRDIDDAFIPVPLVNIIMSQEEFRNLMWKEYWRE